MKLEVGDLLCSIPVSNPQTLFVILYINKTNTVMEWCFINKIFINVKIRNFCSDNIGDIFKNCDWVDHIQKVKKDKK